MHLTELLFENDEKTQDVTINIPITISIPSNGKPQVNLSNKKDDNVEDKDDNPVFVPPLQQEIELRKEQSGKESNVIDSIVSDNGADSDLTNETNDEAEENKKNYYNLAESIDFSELFNIYKNSNSEISSALASSPKSINYILSVLSKHKILESHDIQNLKYRLNKNYNYWLKKAVKNDWILENQDFTVNYLKENKIFDIDQEIKMYLGTEFNLSSKEINETIQNVNSKNNISEKSYTYYAEAYDAVLDDLSNIVDSINESNEKIKIYESFVKSKRHSYTESMWFRSAQCKNINDVLLKFNHQS